MVSIFRFATLHNLRWLYKSVLSFPSATPSRHFLLTFPSDQEVARSRMMPAGAFILLFTASLFSNCDGQNCSPRNSDNYQ